jgi:hypothetical protein
MSHYSPTINTSEIKRVKDLERSIEKPDREEKAEIFGLFGINDPLSNFSTFCHVYSTSPAYWMSGVGHRLSEEEATRFILPRLADIEGQRKLISRFEDCAEV